MSTHIVIGAGPVGSTLALQLADAGHEVKILTRSGSGPVHSSIERLSGDVADGEALGRIATGADAIYNCVNPPYDKWPTAWPPMADAMLSAAEASGAVLVITGNLYGYGPVDHPMTEADPLASTGTKGKVRTAMWQKAQAAHRAGRARVTEVRASDFYGPGVTNAILGDRVMPQLLAGKRITGLGDLDAPHAVTYVPDLTRAMIALGGDERAWGQPWHAPTNPARSVRQMITELASQAGVDVPRLGALPRWALGPLGLAVPFMKELKETWYQFAAPFELDSSAVAETFGLSPTPFPQGFDATIAWWRSQAAIAA